MSELDINKLDKLKVADLQKELAARGLDTKGKKSLLIARLKKAIIAGLDDPVDDADLSVNSALDASQDTSISQDDSSQEPEPVVESVPEVTEVVPEVADQKPEVVEPEPQMEEPEPAEPVVEASESEPEAVPEQEPEPEPTPVEPEPAIEPETVPEPEPIIEPMVSAEEPDEPAEEPQQSEAMETAQEIKAEEEIKTEEAEVEQEPTGEGEPEQKASTETNEQPMVEIKQEIKEESHVNGEKMEEDAQVKQEAEADQQDRGDKRKRSHSRSRSPRERRRSSGRDRDRKSDTKLRRRPRSPIEPEDDEWKKSTNVILDKYNSELHLKINQDCLSANPLSDEGFALVWAGVRSTYGVKSGKVAYEVKLTENLPLDHLGPEETNPHVLRLGWSTDDNNLLLGEEELSFGYGGTAKSSRNLKFADYGEKFTAGDVMTAYMDLESEPAVISFAKNGTHLGTCFEFEKSSLEEKALFPHILTKNTAFECNFGSKEEPYFPLEEGYTFIDKVALEERVRGTEQPDKQEDCEIIMMVGLPAAGKTTWVEKYDQLHPQAKFNILGTNNIIDKMKVMGLPRKHNYAGRWDVLIENSTKCLNRLLEIASKRKRNYILDQTNVYASARRRKMQPFEGFARRAIVVVPEDEEYKKRLEAQQKVEGKEVPESAIYEMKANFTVPDVGMLFDEVEFPEVQRAEAEALVESYREEGQKNLPPPVTSPPEKRFRDDRGRDRRDGGGYGRDRDRRSGGSRWSGGGGGGGGGSRWGGGGGGRDRGGGGGGGRDRWGSGGGGGGRWGGGGGGGGGGGRWGGGGGGGRWDGPSGGGGGGRWGGAGGKTSYVEEMIVWEEWVVVKVVVGVIVVGTAGEVVEEMIVEAVEVEENLTTKTGEAVDLVLVVVVTVTSLEVLVVMGAAVVVVVVVVTAVVVVAVVAAMVVMQAVATVVEAAVVTIREVIKGMHGLVPMHLPPVVTTPLVVLTCRVITHREVPTVRAGVANRGSSRDSKAGDNKLGPIKHSKAGDLRDMGSGVTASNSLQIQIKPKLTMQHGELTILVPGPSGVRTINSTSSGMVSRRPVNMDNKQLLLQELLQGPQLLQDPQLLHNRWT